MKTFSTWASISKLGIILIGGNNCVPSATSSPRSEEAALFGGVQLLTLERVDTKRPIIL
jgi:hypothetical protein